MTTAERSANTDRTDFLFLAGHPCLDFLNTRPVVKGQPVELLGSFEELRALADAAPSGSIRAARPTLSSDWDDGPEGAADRRAAQGPFARRCGTWPTASSGPRRLDRGPRRDQLHPGRERRNPAARATRRAGSAPALRHGRPSAIALLGNVAEAAADLLARGTYSSCAGAPIRTACSSSTTTTRNHRRQWCAMRTCGNLMKVRAFRRRHRKGRIGELVRPVCAPRHRPRRPNVRHSGTVSMPPKTPDPSPARDPGDRRDGPIRGRSRAPSRTRGPFRRRGHLRHAAAAQHRSRPGGQHHPDRPSEGPGPRNPVPLPPGLDGRPRARRRTPT